MFWCYYYLWYLETLRRDGQARQLGQGQKYRASYKSSGNAICNLLYVTAILRAGEAAGFTFYFSVFAFSRDATRIISYYYMNNTWIWSQVLTSAQENALVTNPHTSDLPDLNQTWKHSYLKRLYALNYLTLILAFSCLSQAWTQVCSTL